MTTLTAFSLCDLETFDPQSSTRSGRERRFLCPLCGDGKPRDTAHRSLCASLESGAWNCKRCKATGKLTNFWRDGSKSNARAMSRLRRRPEIVLPPSLAEPQGIIPGAWRDQLHDNRVLDCNSDGAAESYLRSRGIDLETAKTSGVMSAPKFYGRAAVVFPIYDRDGQQIGASGRYFHANATPKTRIAGTKKSGYFSALWIDSNGRQWTAKDKDAPAIIVTEAPIDALSIAMAGFPALALCGTTAPEWFHLDCGLRRVFWALDADPAGDAAAETLTARMTLYGARCGRLRPEGAKDWNEFLCAFGRNALADLLAARVLAA